MYVLTAYWRLDVTEPPLSPFTTTHNDFNVLASPGVSIYLLQGCFTFHYACLSKFFLKWEKWEDQTKWYTLNSNSDSDLEDILPERWFTRSPCNVAHDFTKVIFASNPYLVEMKKLYFCKKRTSLYVVIVRKKIFLVILNFATQWQ